MTLTKVSGSILKDPLNLGEVSIGGTLTYEDVTNVDSIGIITARSGINVSGGQVDIGNNVKIGNAGIGTFAGINLGDNEKINLGASNDFRIYHNTVANSSSPPNYLYANSNYIDSVAAANLFIRTSTAGIYLRRTDGFHSASFHTNGSVVLYHNASGGGGIKFITTPTGVSVTGIVTASSRVSLGNNTTNAVDLEFGTNRGSAGDTLAKINWKWNNTYVAQISGMAGSDTTNKDDAHLVFYTSASGSLNEALRIRSDGKVQIGTQPVTTSGTFNVKGNAVFDDGTNARVTLQADGASTNQILSTTTNFGSYCNMKYQAADHIFLYGGNETARIKTDGTFQVGYLQPADGSSAARAAESPLEIKRHYPEKASGNYWIKDAGGTARQVYCEMETDGGGWLLLNDYNTSQTSMNEALGNTSNSPNSLLSRANNNNYAYYTVWIRASHISASGERLHSFVQLDANGAIKYIADYGSDFFYEDVGDLFQPTQANYYFADASTGEYIKWNGAYVPQLGATSGWEAFSNGGWSQVFVREMDTRISPGDHRSLHLVDRIYGFDDAGVPRWTIAESMNPLPFWTEFSVHGESADGTSDFIGDNNRSINVNNGNNGNSLRGRAHGVLTGQFEYEFQLGYSWGWSMASLVSTIQVAENLRDGASNPFGNYTNPYFHATLMNNSSNNLWYPTSRAAWQSSDTTQSFSPGNNGGVNVLWRETDGTIKAKAKTVQSYTYTFPVKFAGPLIMVSGTQSPHSARLDKVWNSTHNDTALNGRNRWYK